MRKIQTQEMLDKKKKNLTIILSVFMLVILVSGTAGYAFLYSEPAPDDANNPSSGTEHGEVTNLGSQWALNFEGQTLLFRNSPDEVEDIQVDITNTINSYLGQLIYIDSEDTTIFQELASPLDPYVSRIQRACYGPCEENLPEKTCSDNIIVWVESTENKVYQEDNCVFIEGDILAADAFLYTIFK